MVGVKYLIMLYTNPTAREMWASFSDEMRAEGYAAHTEIDESLAASGELILSEALADPSTATRVSTADGDVVTSDGPFAEAKEILAGFYLVDCASRERALEIAAGMPMAAMGLVEVRAVLGLGGLEM
jgi:hypothetical protein